MASEYGDTPTWMASTKEMTPSARPAPWLANTVLLTPTLMASTKEMTPSARPADIKRPWLANTVLLLPGWRAQRR